MVLPPSPVETFHVFRFKFKLATH